LSQVYPRLDLSSATRPELQTCITIRYSARVKTEMTTTHKPVTRIACFRFKTSVTPEQKGDRARAFLGLYRQHQDLIVAMPVGGKPLNTPLNLTNVKRDSVWDLGFIVSFKEETDPLLEQVFVYDFEEEENLGW
ncbi:hypothetical protein D0862_11050, partial [Hortaea werneckii]